MKSSCLAALLGSSSDTVLRLLAFPQEKPELHSPRLCDKSLLIENRIMLCESLGCLEDLEAYRSSGQVENSTAPIPGSQRS